MSSPNRSRRSIPQLLSLSPSAASSSSSSTSTASSLTSSNSFYPSTYTNQSNQNNQHNESPINNDADDWENLNEENQSNGTPHQRQHRQIVQHVNGFDLPKVINQKLRNFLVNIDIGHVNINGSFFKKQQLFTELYPLTMPIGDYIIGIDQPTEESQPNFNFMITQLSIVDGILYLAKKHNHLTDPSKSAYINLRRIDPQVQAFTIQFIDAFYEDFPKLIKKDKEFNLIAAGNPNVTVRRVEFTPLYFKYPRFTSLVGENTVSFSTIDKAKNNDQEAMNSIQEKDLDLELLKELVLDNSYTIQFNRSKEILEELKDEYRSNYRSVEQMESKQPSYDNYQPPLENFQSSQLFSQPSSQGFQSSQQLQQSQQPQQQPQQQVFSPVNYEQQSHMSSFGYHHF
jgi:hypothetical protein